MLRNVAQTIPSYVMSVFLIPRSLCQEIERMMNAFWWKSNSSNSKEIKWLAWDKMSMSKSRVGLGIVIYMSSIWRYWGNSAGI